MLEAKLESRVEPCAIGARLPAAHDARHAQRPRASRCPDCGMQWKDTQSPRCEQWSPHDDWYEKEGPAS